MTLYVRRFHGGENDSIGLLFIDNYFECFTLEDEFRVEKMRNETRVPAGRYTLGLTDSPRFSPRLGHPMLTVLDVPNFDRILIHPGNTEADTAGCLLVGAGVSFNRTRSQLTDSRRAYDRLYVKVAPEITRGVSIIIFNEGSMHDIED